jgi:exportin-1
MSDIQRTLPEVAPQSDRGIDQPSDMVLTFEDDGVHARHTISNTQVATTLGSIRDTLVFLTHLDEADMLSSFYEKMDEIRTGLDRNVMNSFSWAVGALAGAFPDETEDRFIAEVLEFLIGLSGQFPPDSVDERAVVARGLMYVCSRYYQVVSRHDELLSVVMQKLIEFMKEPLEGMQDAAVEAMKLIATACRAQLVQRPSADKLSFLERLLEELPVLFAGLAPCNVIEMHEICSQMIQSIQSMAHREPLVVSLTCEVNGKFAELQENPQVLDEEWGSQMVFVLSGHEKIAQAVQMDYVLILQQI